MQTGIDETWDALRQSMRGCKGFDERFAELRRQAGDAQRTKNYFGMDAHEMCAMYVFMFAQISKASSHEDIRKSYLDKEESYKMWVFFSLLWNFLNDVAERGDV